MILGMCNMAIGLEKRCKATLVCHMCISNLLRTLLAGRVANTMLLSLFTLIVTYLIAIPLGIIAGRWTDTWADKMIVTYNYFAFATPYFRFCTVDVVSLQLRSRLVPNWWKCRYTGRRRYMGLYRQ